MEVFSPHLFSVLGFSLAFVLSIRLLRERRPPGSTVAWLLAIFLIPYIGVPLYLIFGGRKIRKLAEDKYPLYGGKGGSHLDQFPNDTERILGMCGVPSPTFGNQMEFLVNGEAAYHRLIQMLDSAKSTIRMTTFILGRDPVGRGIVDCLTRKAQSGVEVCLLLDALGSIKTRGRFCDPLRKAGGKVGVFMPMLPIHRKWSANLRNHRKMVLVDSRRALIGGMNLGIQYMGDKPDPNRWHDFGTIFEGPAVQDVGKVFSSDWYFATGEMLPRQPSITDTREEGAQVQVVASGPDVYTDPFYQALLTLLSGAKKRVWLVTPYFIPDDTLTRILSLLARLGRDVRVIIPAKSNHLIADLARGAYLRELRLAGVKFFAFLPGMLHSKITVVDDSHAIVGSANLDIRSLYLNYEIALFIQSRKEVEALAQIVSNLLTSTQPMVGSSKAWRGEVKEWIEDACRVLAPLL